MLGPRRLAVVEALWRPHTEFMTNLRSIPLARRPTRGRSARVRAAPREAEHMRALERLLMLQALSVAAAITLALYGLARLALG